MFRVILLLVINLVLSGCGLRHVEEIRNVVYIGPAGLTMLASSELCGRLTGKVMFGSFDIAWLDGIGSVVLADHGDSRSLISTFSPDGQLKDCWRAPWSIDKLVRTPNSEELLVLNAQGSQSILYSTGRAMTFVSPRQREKSIVFVDSPSFAASIGRRIVVVDRSDANSLEVVSREDFEWLRVPIHGPAGCGITGVDFANSRVVMTDHSSYMMTTVCQNSLRVLTSENLEHWNYWSDLSVPNVVPLRLIASNTGQLVVITGRKSIGKGGAWILGKESIEELSGAPATGVFSINADGLMSAVKEDDGYQLHRYSFAENQWSESGVPFTTDCTNPKFATDGVMSIFMLCSIRQGELSQGRYLLQLVASQDGGETWREL